MTSTSILLVEDNPDDARLTIRALKKQNVVNNLIHLKDGEEALDFFFAKGAYVGRNTNNMPKVILLDLKMPKINSFCRIKLSHLPRPKSTNCITDAISL